MKINNNLLEAENTKEKIVISISKNARDLIVPNYLIIHYTATDTAAKAIDWFMNDDRKENGNPDFIAAHIVVDFDGTITQLIPFNKRANHSGTSTWDGTDSMNYHSIGIEIVNAGFVEKMADGTFRRRSGKGKFQTFPANKNSQIIKAAHKHKFWVEAENQYWFKFPKAQLEAVYALSKVLMGTYHLSNAIGHDDISPARKPDPGPAFPWSEFKTKVLGTDNNIGKIYKVNSTDGSAFFRSEPTTNSSQKTKLANGYEVGLIETNGAWCKVYLVNTSKEVLIKIGKSNKSIKSIGWIHESLLSLK
jgi:N-acetylmuramoyl-L-alanine amidase